MSRSPGVLSIITVLREESNGMQVVHRVCGGIDGHPTQLTAGLRRVGEDGTIHPEWRDFGTTYDALMALRAWLAEQGCPIVVLESTGVPGKRPGHRLIGRGAPMRR